MKHQPLSVYARRLSFFTALASLAITVPSLAQSVWTGGGDNEFSNGVNWTPDAPGLGDTATVNTGSPQVTGDASIDRLGVNGGNVTITNTGTLTVTSGTTITSGSVGINAGGVLSSDVDLNGGSLFIDGALDGQLMLNAGNVTVNGALSGATVGATTSLSNNGTAGDVSVSAAGTFTNNGSGNTGTLTNAGTASNAGTIGSVTNTAGNFTNNAGGRVTGNTVVTGGTVTNNFVVTDVDVAAAAAFTNNRGATAGDVRNSGTVDNAGTIASLQNDAGSFTNNVDGTITGNTTVAGGTVTNNFVVTDVDVAAAAAFVNNNGATAGNVRNSGTFDNAGTVASLQNEAGNFTNNAGGTITGATTVSGGTVTNNFVVTDVDVAAAAAFVNNNGASAGAVINSGNIANSGTIASLQNNGGLFTNNGGGSVTGTTKVNGGAVVNNAALSDVEIDGQGTFTNNSSATAGAVTNSGTSSNDGTIASLINQSGYFSNTGTISGAAAVTGGELVNQGNVAGTIDVSAGGVLSGSGNTGGLVVGNGGTLSPGPGFETVDVNGDLTFRPGSTYQVDIGSPGVSDRADASGALRIDGGTLRIRAASDTYGLTNNYTILTGGTVTGAFTDIASNFAFLSPTLSYGATAVDLALDRNSVSFADMARTGNDRATAAAVESMGATNPLFIAVLPLDTQTAESAFSQLNGEAHASLKSALMWQSQFVRDAIIDNTGDLAGPRPVEVGGVSFWTTGILAQNDFASDGNARAFDSRITGALFGADVSASDNWRLGGLAGYSHVSTPSGGSADSYHGGLYADGSFGPLGIRAGTIFSRNDISIRREIAFGSFADQLSSDYASTMTQVFGDISWTLDMADLRLQPFANLAYVNLDTDSFRESGGAAALSVFGDTKDIVLSTIGLRWSADLIDGDLPVVASGMLGWRHAAGDLSPGSRFAFDAGSPFVLEGVTMPQDAVVLKAGISAKLSKAARLTLSYAGEFGNGLQSNAAHANLTVNF